jgi:hypothetical protein
MVSIRQEVHDLLPGRGVFDIIVEDDLDIGQAEDAGRPEADLVLYRVHGDLDGNGHELLDFFGAAAGPLGDDVYLRIRDIGKGLDGHVQEGDDTADDQQGGGKQDEIFIFKRETDNSSKKFSHWNFLLVVQLIIDLQRVRCDDLFSCRRRRL